MGESVAERVASEAARYDEFGRAWAHGTSPLYEDWALGIARDPELLRRLAGLDRRMSQPNLVFAAVRSNGGPLGEYSVVRAWLLEHWDLVVETAATRRTQTNEPNRCATWIPQLALLDGPLALLEVGAAGGLCLYPDRYGYDYDTPDGPRTLDPPAGPSPARMACRVDDGEAIPHRVPTVAWRLGIDLDPIDVRDAASVDWLTALVWPGPDHDARVARLRAAASVVAADPPAIVAGDLLETVIDAAASAPADATLVVFHSAVLMYLGAAARQRFAETMIGLAGAVGRRVVWLSNETRGVFAAVDATLPRGLRSHHRFIQTRDGMPVALAGQHGATYETAPFRR